MSEETLNRLRAEGMTPEGRRAEMDRIKHAITRAARPRDVERYQRRLAIFEQVHAAAKAAAVGAPDSSPARTETTTIPTTPAP